ncbi:MAG: hypothetical protein K2X12_15125, partial [Burkholderiaceae bacterium]|nr:hypothetical protein [Burkholderiaceae bacterium]
MPFPCIARQLPRLAALLAVVAGAAQATTPPALSTHAEHSGLLQTGRYAEVGQLCHDFARAHP